jgi:hypothetical protein
VRIHRVLFAALIALSAPAVRAAEHPRLFFGAGDVAALRARAGSTHATIADGLRNGSAEWMGSTVGADGVVRWPGGKTYSLGDKRDVGNSLVVWSFLAQLDQSPAAIETAKTWLLSVAGFGSFDLDGERDLALAHTLGGAAIAYDLLHPFLTDAERTKVRTALVREAGRMASASGAGLWWSASYTQNHNWINHAALGLTALAVQGEADAGQVESWLSLATENAKRIGGAIEGITDGTWHEGWSYQSYGFTWHLPFIEALRRSGRADLTDLPILRGLGAARLYAQIPEAPNTHVLATGDFFGFNMDEGLLSLRYAASRFGDGLAQAAADRWMKGTPRKVYAPEANQQVFEFLFFDANVAAADLQALPLDWFGADLQAVVFRSGWDKGSTLFSLKNGAMGGRSVWEKLANGDKGIGALNFSHDHADDNGFYLYANGAWAAPEAQGYFIGHRDSPGPEANQTVFHNSLLVDGQGQLGSGVRPNSDNAHSYDWFFRREGSIPFVASSENFAFATGDGAKLYSPSLGVTRWDRNALFLDREHVILFDVVEASQPRAFSWLSHFTGDAAREGRWIRGRGEAGQALGIATVAPANPAVAFWGQSPQKASKFVADGSFTVAEVKSAPTTQAVFLNALVPTPEAAWGSKPSVEPLDAARPEAGLVLAKGGRRTVAIFSKDGARESAGGATVEGLAGVVATENGAPVRAVVVQGTSVSDGGREVLSVPGGTDLLEADGLGGAAVTLSGPSLKDARLYAPSATKVLWYGREVPAQRSGESLVVSLPAPLAGDGPVMNDLPATQGAPGAAGGGGCGSAAGVGDVLAIAAALLALILLGRARHRRHALSHHVTNLPLHRKGEDRKRKLGS